MSKLDDILDAVEQVHSDFGNREDDELARNAKRKIKKLILDTFRDVKYDPWEFVEEIEKL